ncbi:InlB B-repeat-containing protein [Bifidobacterium oedipodis]|uniref:DUF5648 domain-containing protein n=1 Tax=Bifidobacterium oedipodis TaxID=2675322 RepID=A0A7Y0ETC7_9BIFI|nr:InlB B-repeat-containing protein [Bifidobacterium sp. DSM 109957]NMM95006.1 hypothetical protein [Bifidobacterium sp. DSM 109957]
MTGNKNVWRAPLAGLASVAMIATMGVAASTANAAATAKPADITFAGNGLSFIEDGKTVDTYTIKSDGDARLDDEAAKAYEALTEDSKKVFTGWFASADYGTAALELDNSSDAYEHTVYAHWSETPYTVNFTGKSVKTSEVTLAENDGKLDRVADWQVPADKDKNDGVLLTGWLAADGDAVDPTTDLSGKATHGETEINLKATEVSSVYIVFTDQDLWSKRTIELTVTNGNGDASYSVEAEKGKPYTGTVPTATIITDGARKTAQNWVKSDKKTKFDASKAQNESATYYAADTTDTVSYKVSFATGSEENGYSEAPEAQIVESGKTASAPADPTLKTDDNYKYEFVGWYTQDDKKYDFSNPVTGEISLQAKFKVSEVKLTFKSGYRGGETTEAWFKGGVVDFPALTRDGYTLLGWTPAFADGTPLTLNSEPAVAPTATLTYLVFMGEKPSVTVPVSGTIFTAQWVADDEAEDTLTKLEQKVAKDKVTEESYKQYQSDFQDYLKAKDKAAENGYTVDEYAALIKQLKEIQAKLVQTAPVKVYRLYNKWNGDHVYTTNLKEYQQLSNIGWTTEGVQFNVTDDASFGTAVYRLYNPFNGEHLLTADKTEAAGLAEAGWVFDKDGGLVDEDGNPVYFYAPQGATTGVTRLFNPYVTVGTHLYTTDQSEIDSNVKLGWVKENVLFNVAK